MKILITEFMEAKSVEMLKTNFDVTVDQDLSLNTNELKKIINNFDAIIVRNKTQVNKEVLENTDILALGARASDCLARACNRAVYEAIVIGKSKPGWKSLFKTK